MRKKNPAIRFKVKVGNNKYVKTIITAPERIIKCIKADLYELQKLYPGCTIEDDGKYLIVPLHIYILIHRSVSEEILGYYRND